MIKFHLVLQRYCTLALCLPLFICCIQVSANPPNRSTSATQRTDNHFGEELDRQKLRKVNRFIKEVSDASHSRQLFYDVTSTPENYGAAFCSTDNHSQYYDSGVGTCHHCEDICHSINHQCLDLCQGYLAHNQLPKLFAPKEDAQLNFSGCLARITTQLKAEIPYPDRETFFQRRSPYYYTFHAPPFWKSLAPEMLKPFITRLSQKKSVWKGIEDVVMMDFEQNNLPPIKTLSQPRTGQHYIEIRNNYLADLINDTKADTEHPLSHSSPKALYSLAEYTCMNTFDRYRGEHPYLLPFSRESIVFFIPEEAENLESCINETKRNMRLASSEYNGLDGLMRISNISTSSYTPNSAETRLRKLYGGQHALDNKISAACHDLLAQESDDSIFTECQQLRDYTLVGTARTRGQLKSFTAGGSGKLSFMDDQSVVIDEMTPTSEITLNTGYRAQLTFSQPGAVNTHMEEIRNRMILRNSVLDTWRVLGHSFAVSNNDTHPDHLNTRLPVMITCIDNRRHKPVEMTGNHPRLELTIALPAPGMTVFLAGNTIARSEYAKAASDGSRSIVYQFHIPTIGENSSLIINTKVIPRQTHRDSDS